jgi:predicted Zn-dependent peptidase
MIELLKYLANNLRPEQLLEVAHIISQHPEMIDSDTFMEIVNEVNDYEMRRVSDSEYKEMEKRFNDIDEIRINSTIHKLLKDNNIGLN